MLHTLATGMYIPYLGSVEEDFKRGMHFFRVRNLPFEQCFIVSMIICTLLFIIHINQSVNEVESGVDLLKKAGFVGQGGFWMLLALLVVPAQASAGNKELVMFGSRSCVYCQVFNRKVAPGYRRSGIGHRAPLKKIDIHRHGTGGYALRGGPITVTPTFIMFKRGREVARIKGYPGKKNFYRMVRRILSRVK